MTFRRAISLTLVGWYLLVPALVPSNAPLSRWFTYKIFDNAADCTNALDEMSQRAAKAAREHGGKDLSYRNRCVASDDPRLAK